MAEESELEKKRRLLVAAVMREMAKLIEEKIPESGSFERRYFYFDFPGYDHTGMLSIQYIERHGCSLRASVVVRGTDMAVSHYLISGSKQECIDWLREESHLRTLLDSYLTLSESADDKA